MPTVQHDTLYPVDTFIGGRIARRSELRRAVLDELRRWSGLFPGLYTTDQRIAIADRALNDHAWMRRRSGYTVAAVGREVLDAWLGGQWEEPDHE